MIRAHAHLTLKRKIKYFCRDEFCGYITPQEALRIAEMGGILAPFDLIHCGKMKEKGNSNPYWVYFTVKPHSELEDYLELKKE